jgi:hypothetical protein
MTAPYSVQGEAPVLAPPQIAGPGFTASRLRWRQATGPATNMFSLTKHRVQAGTRARKTVAISRYVYAN